MSQFRPLDVAKNLVSKCSHNLSFQDFFTIWDFVFCHILSLWVMTQFELNFVTFWILSHLSFWVLSHFDFWSFVKFWVVTNLVLEFLSFVTIWVEFCHNLSFWVFLNFSFQVLSPFELFRFVDNWVFEFCHNLSCDKTQKLKLWHNLIFWSYLKNCFSSQFLCHHVFFLFITICS